MMQPLPTAPVWRRFAALVYDSFILLALSFAYGAVLTAAGAAMHPDMPHDYQPMFHSPLVIVGWFLVLAGFYAWFWKRGGQTIGMKTWRIQLVNTKPKPISWSQIGLRILVGIPATLCLGISYWFRLIDASGDCLHDKLSHTHVIVLPKKAKK